MMPVDVRKASVTFRVTSLLGIQQRWASLQRAPVAGVPYLLALSKSSLNGVLGVWLRLGCLDFWHVGRTPGEGQKEELRNSFQNCGTKNKGPARRISCKPLICLVPEPGVEPGRPYERGILSLMSDIAIQHCLMKLCFLSDFSTPPKAAGSFKSDSLVLGDVLFSNL